MKICAISDTHLHKVRDLPEADVLVHAGDWSSYGGESDTMQFLAWLDDIEHKFGDIVVVPGNHDRWPFAHPAECRKLFEDRGFHYLEDSGVDINGIKFYGMPWTPIFGQWAFMADQAARKKRCDDIHGDTDVLITHGPPHGFMDGVEHFDGRKCEWETLHCGCQELLRTIERIKPRLHIFGHIHEGSGVEDYGKIKLVNASIMDKHYRPVNPYRIVEL